MFTGIIQDLGTLNKINKGIFKVSTSLDLSNCNEGSSISCNGVCLTAKNIIKNKDISTFDVNIGEETFKRTNLKNCLTNSNVINIEKSLNIGDEIGGHFVYGHVDAVTSLIEVKKLANSWEYYFKKDFGDENKFIVEKASIAINGISLTIANVFKNSFFISVIDHTYNNTNLKYLEIGDNVNIEFDYLARFVLKDE